LIDSSNAKPLKHHHHTDKKEHHHHHHTEGDHHEHHHKSREHSPAKELHARHEDTFSTPKKHHHEGEHHHHRHSETKTSSSAKKYKSPLKQEEEVNLAYSIKDQANLEKDLDRAKEQLANRYDFNFFDAFNLLDEQIRGYVTLTDLKIALEH